MLTCTTAINHPIFLHIGWLLTVLREFFFLIYPEPFFLNYIHFSLSSLYPLKVLVVHQPLSPPTSNRFRCSSSICSLSLPQQPCIDSLIQPLFPSCDSTLSVVVLSLPVIVANVQQCHCQSPAVSSFSDHIWQLAPSLSSASCLSSRLSLQFARFVFLVYIFFK